jgi:hypothetical protein
LRVTTKDILADCARADIVLDVEGDRLVVDAPTGGLTQELRDRLLRHKPTLLPVVWRLREMRRLAVEAPRAVVYARIEAKGGPGRCFSCGDGLEHPRAFGRCAPCDIASDLFYATLHDGDAVEVF